MIASRKKNGVLPSETVEDRAAQDFRDLVRKRGRHRKEKKPGSLMYAAGACMALVLVIMGVSMFNSADRMKSVQTTLETLADAERAEESPETEETVDESSAQAETQAASAPVTAVTPDEMQADESREDEAQPDKSSVQPDEAQPDKSSVQPDASEEDGQQADDEAAAAGANGSNGVYVVEKGDTLAIISKKMYGDVSHVDAICRMNGISNGNLIYIGQKLLLP